jgi:hypothetical protein
MLSCPRPRRHGARTTPREDAAIMLMEQSLGAMLKVAFSVYGLFWVVAILALFFFVGLLLKKEERALEKQKHHH